MVAFPAGPPGGARIRRRLGPPAPGWSPLPPDVQQAQWNHAINAPEQALKLIVLWLLFGLMMAFCTVLTAVAGPDPQARAVAGLLALVTVG